MGGGNFYWQYFCGEAEMPWGAPCEPSDLVHFRHRIGEAGIQLILAVSIQLHGPKGGEKEVVIDTTVQEKNVTYPTDTKLYRKVIMRCWKLADKEQIQLRRRYRKGFAGDTRNLLLAAAAWNFKKWLNLAVSFYLNFLRWFLSPSSVPSLRLRTF